MIHTPIRRCPHVADDAAGEWSFRIRDQLRHGTFASLRRMREAERAKCRSAESFRMGAERRSEVALQVGGDKPLLIYMSQR